MNSAWLPVAIASYLLLSINGTVDRAIVHQEKTKPIVISFWVALFSVATFGLVLLGFIPLPVFEGFRLSFDSPFIIALALIAGAMSQAGLYFMYEALEDGEATRVLSSMGALTPIVSLVAAYFFLDERLGSLAFVAFLILIAATVVLTYEPKKKSNHHHWVVNAFLASLFLGLQTVVIKHVFDNYDFIPAFALTGLGAGLYIAIISTLSKHVRHEIKTLISPTKSKKKADKPSAQVKWIFANSILGGFAVMLLNYAISLGSPTLVNSLRGVQYAGVFLIALIIAKKIPHLLDEDLTKMSIFIKSIGIVLIINGIALLAISTN